MSQMDNDQELREYIESAKKRLFELMLWRYRRANSKNESDKSPILVCPALGYLSVYKADIDSDVSNAFYLNTLCPVDNVDVNIDNNVDVHDNDSDWKN